MISGSDFGGIGLLQTRTARFAPDGQAEVAYSFVPPYKKYLFTLQAVPWLEATFRYSDVRNRTFFGVAPFTPNGEKVSFKDRGFDVKLKLFDEGRYRPAAAVGFQDALGTGIFASEYVVLNKRFLDLDFSFGLAWGYLGNGGSVKNPLLAVSDLFRSRSDDFGFGGTLGFGDWFAGDTISPFGGVQYETPIRGLALKLEYDGNDYSDEPLGNRFKARSRINYGVVYRMFPWFDLSVGYERGERFMFRGGLRANIHDPGIPKFQDPPPPAITVRPAEPTPRTTRVAPRQVSPLNEIDSFDSVVEVQISGDVATIYVNRAMPLEESVRAARGLRSAVAGGLGIVRIVPLAGGGPIRQLAAPTDEAVVDGLQEVAVFGDGTVEIRFDGDASNSVTREHLPVSVSQMLFKDLRSAGLKANSVDVQGETLTVTVEPRRYLEVATSIGRAARVMTTHAPPDVEVFEIAYAINGTELSRTTILRKDIEAVASASGSPEEILSRAKIEEGQRRARKNQAPIANPDRFPSIRWSASPNLRQHVGGGDRFYAFQLYLSLGAVVEPAPGLSLVGSVGKDVYNNFDELFVDPPRTELPPVRSLIKDYLQQGEDNLIRLQGNYVRRIGGPLYGRLSAGIFEEMYAGVGGEVLFRPQQSRFAAGFDVNYVRQRDFKQLLGLFDYSVVTGHLNVYYDVPFADLDAEINIGQYLAGDRGATFQVSRSFRGGMRIGGFFTLTDVPFSVFGEGSFDKGLFLSVPLQLFQTTSSRSVGSFGFRPLTKDGGQKLAISPRLHNLVKEGSLESVTRAWDKFLE